MRLFLLGIVLALSGCSFANNLPLTHPVPAIVDLPPTVSLYFDSNGDLYPRDWSDWTGLDGRVKATHSLRKALGCTTGKGEPSIGWKTPCGAESLARLDASGAAQIDAVGTLARDARRVIVMIHGFNSDEDKSNMGFAALGQRVRWRPGDLLVHVYWDGLTASGLGIPRIWFWAVANSQMVGARGLRRVLRAMPGKDIVLISHSRGASVALSALSNPPYAGGFRDGTAKAYDEATMKAMVAPPALGEADRHITLLLLAPAIGFPDFWKPECGSLTKAEKAAGKAAPTCGDPPGYGKAAGADCRDYRQFGSELQAIHYSVNDGDIVLKKGVGRASRLFNATDLGFSEPVGDALRQCYPAGLFHKHVLPRADTHGHDFPLYARDPAAGAMLDAVLNR